MRLIVTVSDDRGTVLYSADADIDATALTTARERTQAARTAVTQVADRIADGAD